MNHYLVTSKVITEILPPFIGTFLTAAFTKNLKYLVRQDRSRQNMFIHYSTKDRQLIQFKKIK